MDSILFSFFYVVIMKLPKNSPDHCSHFNKTLIAILFKLISFFIAGVFLSFLFKMADMVVN